MPQRLAAFALTAFAVGTEFIFEQLADVCKDGSGDDYVDVDRQRPSHEAGHGLGAVAGNVHHAALVLHERNRAIRNQQREGDLIQIFRLQRTALQRLNPGLRDLLPQLGIADPLNLRPKALDGLPHCRTSPTGLTRLSERVRRRRGAGDKAGVLGNFATSTAVRRARAGRPRDSRQDAGATSGYFLFVDAAWAAPDCAVSIGKSSMPHPEVVQVS